jgi:hypothetical protein
LTHEYKYAMVLFGGTQEWQKHQTAADEANYDTVLQRQRQASAPRTAATSKAATTSYSNNNAALTGTISGSELPLESV